MRKTLLLLVFVKINLLSIANIDKANKLNDEAYQLIEAEPDHALEKSVKAFVICDSLDNNIGKINSLTIQGIIYKNRGFYEVSVDKYLKALSICEIIKDEQRKSVIYNNLGIIYLNQSNFNKAIEYFENALEIENKGSNNEEQKSIRLYNLGDAYLQLDSFDLAKTYFYNSLLLDQKIKNAEGVVYAKIGIASCLLSQSKDKEYLSLIDEIKSISGVSKIQNIMINSLIGDFYKNKLEFNKSRKLYNTALSIAEDINNKPEKLKLLHKLYSLCKKENDYNMALNYLELYNKLENELNSVKKASLIEEMHYMYDIEKKENEIKLLKKEKQLEKVNLAHEKSVKNYLFVTVVLIALFFVNNISKLVRGNNEK